MISVEQLHGLVHYKYIKNMRNKFVVCIWVQARAEINIFLK